MSADEHPSLSHLSPAERERWLADHNLPADRYVGPQSEVEVKVEPASDVDLPMELHAVYPRPVKLPGNLPVGHPYLSVPLHCPECMRRLTWCHCADAACPMLYCPTCGRVVRVAVNTGGGVVMTSYQRKPPVAEPVGV